MKLYEILRKVSKNPRKLLLGIPISIFSGDTDVQQEMESLLLLKHDKAKFADLIQAVSEIHPYDTPCITQIEVKDTNKEYLQWCNMILE